MEEYIGEIYLVKNKVNGKCYVGQAQKYVGKIKMRWGTNGRWKSHLREAKDTIDKGKKDHCTILNAAIRKHGEENFEVTKLADCKNQDEMNEFENKYIIEYNSMIPTGYNLNTGGFRGKDSEETCEKKRLMRIGQTHSDETKENIGKSQIGNRRGTKVRKYPEDANLPKYISATRNKEKIIIGYKVDSFPIGIDVKKYISKSFSSKDDPKKSYENALSFLDELKNQYKNLQTEIADTKVEPPQKISVERNNVNITKKGSDKYDMPKYISMKTSGNKEIGFEIRGIRIVNEDNTISGYSKSFVDQSQSMEEKLELAIKHLDEIIKTHKCLIDEHLDKPNINVLKKIIIKIN